MHALILMLSLMFSPVQQDVLSVRDCLLKSGMSTEFYSHPHVLTLSGQSAWEQADQDALRYGDVLTSEYIETNAGRRKVTFIAYAGSIYIFVFMHWDDPRAHVGSTPGATAWHGECMLRID